MTRFSLARPVCALALCTLLAACSMWSDKDPEDMPENWPEKKLYFAAKDRLDSGSCSGAIEYYGEMLLERGDVTGARRMLARLDSICTFGCAQSDELRRWIDRGPGRG